MSIYVISNDLNSKNNLFKIGRTKNTNVDILSKYQRYLSGARLLLWYPSTDCVSDERKLLEMFKSNRGHTPNGFRNEWLNISFVELKSKLDIFFGFSGDDFEEEQKQNKIFNCKYCNKTFTRTNNLTRHYLVCKSKEINSNKEKYEYENQIMREQYEREIQNLRIQLQNQQLQIKKLETQIFEIAKQPKESHIHNNTQNK
jgi:hypothetical protein